ncbi:MAG: arsenic transporter [Polyangiaceae bacterium]
MSTEITAGHAALFAIIAASIVLMLVRPRGIAEVWWVGAGACLLVLLRLEPLGQAVRAMAKGSDVYAFLAGMMLISQLAQRLGVFDWLSAWAVRAANQSCSRLFTILYGVGTLVTVFMSNDATAVVLTPAVLFAVRKAKVAPLAHLFVCALIANAASFVLPISNPANLVVFGSGMPTLGSWLVAFSLPSVLSIIVTYVALRVHFRRELRLRFAYEAEEVPLTSGGKGVLAGLALLAIVLLFAAAQGVDLGLPTLLASVAVTGLVCLRAKLNPFVMLRDISWSTLLLVSALFVLVDAAGGAGVLGWAAGSLKFAETLPASVSPFLTSFVVGVGNNLVNNLPLGLVASAAIRAAHPSPILTQSVLIGVDLGPNLSITGSLATILWLIALRKEGVEVRFLDFLKIGIVVMPLALLAAVSGLVITHALAGR